MSGAMSDHERFLRWLYHTAKPLADQMESLRCDDRRELYALRADTLMAIGGVGGSLDKLCALLGREIDDLERASASAAEPAAEPKP